MKSDLSTRLCYRQLGSPLDHGTVDLSVVAPAFNEAGNLTQLVAEVRSALARVDHEGRPLSWELILVDDGSTDGTRGVIEAAARLGAEPSAQVRGFYLDGQHGQTAALATGIAHARGRWIATIDADLQNDPADLPALLVALGENDAVLGYRKTREDSSLRRLSSRAARVARRIVLGDTSRDTGCSLRLFRAEALRTLPLFDGMHRFFPILLQIHGFQSTEHPVAHRPRASGTSSYGVLNRAFRTTRDLFTIRWIRSRTLHLSLTRPEPGSIPPR